MNSIAPNPHMTLCHSYHNVSMKYETWVSFAAHPVALRLLLLALQDLGNGCTCSVGHREGPTSISLLQAHCGHCTFYFPMGSGIHADHTLKL